MGRSFFEMTMERIREYNTPAFVQLGNADIGIDSTVARLLTGDNILRIVSANNPDGAGQAPSWMAPPGPINLYESYFRRTLLDPQEHGVVHIMVVNETPVFDITENAMSDSTEVLKGELKSAQEEIERLHAACEKRGLAIGATSVHVSAIGSYFSTLAVARPSVFCPPHA